MHMLRGICKCHSLYGFVPLAMLLLVEMCIGCNANLFNNESVQLAHALHDHTVTCHSEPRSLHAGTLVQLHNPNSSG